jgi:hypothetical protein
VTLPQHVQNHLVVAYLALRDLVEEMEAIATRGVAKSGTGRKLTPLPAGEWEQMAPHLERVVAEARALAEQHAPGRLREYETRGPMGQTRSWLSAQLGRLEDALRDLSPERLSRFGALPPDLVSDLDARLFHAHEEISRLRSRKEPKR